MKFIDGHCDSILTCYNDKIDFFDTKADLHLNFSKMREANLALQFFALYIESKYKPYGALEQALKLIQYFKKNILANKKIGMVKDRKGLKDFGKKPLGILAMEGGEPLGESLEVLEILFELGIRSIGLTWNERNAIANGCLDTNLGLSKFGRQVVIKMQELGMLVDCAHISESSLTEIISIAKKPIIISHACCSALHNHPRNISDINLKALSQNGGVIGITFVPYFLSDKDASIDTVVKHILHAANIAGIDHVGIGSDFDGFDDLPANIEGVQSLQALADKLKVKGLNTSEVEKITCGNFLRVLNETLPE